MKITSLNKNQQTFLSKNSAIRKADDIVRKVRNDFPIFSQTYAIFNWKIMNRNDKNYLYKICNQSFTEKFCNIRKHGPLSSKNPIFIDIFKKIQEEKIANCAEYSNLTLGTLFANGYENSIKVFPYLEISVLKDGKLFFKNNVPCDHSVVLSKIKNNENSSKTVILDTWLGRAMNIQEALIEYKKIFQEKETLIAIKKTEDELKDKIGQINFLYDLLTKKYEYKVKMGIGEFKEDRFSPQEARKYGKELLETFPFIKL